jgi:hypothetical protein
LEHFRLVQELRSLRATLDRKYGFENIIGHSEALLSVLERQRGPHKVIQRF